MKLKTTVYNEPAQDPRLARRQRKADALRRHALSPLRILLMVLALPLTTGMIALGVYLRTSDLERTEAVMHLVALAGCDAARFDSGKDHGCGGRTTCLRSSWKFTWGDAVV